MKKTTIFLFIFIFLSIISLPVYSIFKESKVIKKILLGERINIISPDNSKGEIILYSFEPNIRFLDIVEISPQLIDKKGIESFLGMQDIIYLESLNLPERLHLEYELRKTPSFRRRYQQLYRKENKEEIIGLVLNSEKMSPFYARPKFLSSDQEITQKIVVDVWNATNIPRLGEKVSKNLRKYGVDVVKWDTYPKKENYTQVIDRTGNINIAYQIAELINCKNVKTELAPALLVDVSLILGGDFQIENGS